MAIELNRPYPAPVDPLGSIANIGMQGGSTYYQYKTNADGTIGIDYFVNGAPVDNTSFGAITGVNTAFLEDAVRNDGASTTPGVPAPIQTAPTAQRTTLSSQEYNDILKAYEASKAMIDKAHESGLMTYDLKVKSVGNLRQGLEKELKDAMGENRGYFSSVSPNAYQSQKESYDNDVVQQYNMGKSNISDYEGQLNQAKSEWEMRYNLAKLGASQEKNALLANNKAGSTFGVGDYNISSNFGGEAPASAGATPLAATAARAGGGAVPVTQQRSVADYNAGSGLPIEDYIQTGMV